MTTSHSQDRHHIGAASRKRSRLNILIVGLGSIARKHIDALKMLDANGTIIALRTSEEIPTPEGITVIRDLAELNVPVDLALVCNPTHLHATTIAMLLPTAKFLFIEKPVVRTVGEGENLLPAVRKAGIHTHVGCHLRFHPCLRYVREHITNGHRINEVNVYCGSNIEKWQPGRDYRTSFRRNEKESGGVHLELIHEFDYVRWLFGPPQKSRGITRRLSHLEMEAPDYANFALQYEHFTASVILNYYRRDPKRTLEIVFDDRTWLVDLLKFDIHENGILQYHAEGGVADLYIEQMRYVLDCMRTNRAPENSFTEALETLRTALPST